MMNKLWSVLLVLSIVTLSCKKETRDLKEVQDQEIQNFLGASISNFTKDTSGIRYSVLAQGEGDSLKNASVIYYYQTMQVVNGASLSNNNRFNYFANSVGYLNPIGLRYSVLAMVKNGGKIRSIIPSYLAYGKNGNGSLIPGNALIDVTIELINAKTAQAAEDSIITKYAKTLSLTFTRDESGVYYSIINPGTGTADVSLTSNITVNYLGKFFNGEQFDASAVGVPLVTTFDGLIKGWQVLTKIKKGGKIRLLIPSQKAYGTTGNRSIPANCPLDFEIELVDLK